MNQEICTKILPKAVCNSKKRKTRSNLNVYHNTMPSNNENKPIVTNNTKDAFQGCKLWGWG